jgi:hypothetical protein
LSRTYTTIAGQNTYDLAVQQFGTLNNLDKVMRQVPDLNEVVPFGSALVFDNTNNNLVRRFESLGVKFATGATSEIAPLFDIFDDTFDDTFN